MSHQPSDKVIYTANQNILTPIKKYCLQPGIKVQYICYNRSNLHKNCKRLLNTLTKRGYNKKDTTTQINRAISISRNELINKIKPSNTERLLLTVTYNRTLPDFKTTATKTAIFYKLNQN